MMHSNIHIEYKDYLDQFPFIIIIGKYDHILGPRALCSTVNIMDKSFIDNLLRDSLNTKNKYVILDFNHFYSQVCKIDVEDEGARGGKQLYALILLRHKDLPIIPIIHLKRMEMMFHKIGHQTILNDIKGPFKKYIKDIQKIYMNKEQLLPLESFNIQIRSGLNTIYGFCELILEENEKKTITIGEFASYIEMMKDSCKEITESVDKYFSSNNGNSNGKC